MILFVLKTTKRKKKSFAEHARKIGFSVYARLRKSSLPRHIQDLHATQNMDSDKIMSMQSERLYTLLCHARNTTEFYRQHIPNSFSVYESMDVLKTMPVLSRRQIKADPDAVISKAIPRSKLYHNHTSGSTGTPLPFWMDQQRRIRCKAEIVYFGGWAGYRFGMRYLYLTADAESRYSSWIKNEVTLNPTYMTEEWFEKLDAILRFSRVQILFTHPSPLIPFLKHCQKEGHKFPRNTLNSVVCLGEPITPQLRALVESVLHCPLFGRYSAREVGTLAGECEYGRYHFNVGSFYAEYLQLKTDSPKKTGPARLILTDFFNYGMPLIRYDIGDVVVPAYGGCECGRSSPIILEIRGRVTEIIATPEGNDVDPIQICDVLRKTPGIQYFQFIQQSENRYCVKLVPDLDYRLEHVPEIVHGFQKILGSNALVEVQTVTHIPSLSSGKRPLVVRNC